MTIVFVVGRNLQRECAYEIKNKPLYARKMMCNSVFHYNVKRFTLGDKNLVKKTKAPVLCTCLGWWWIAFLIIS